MALIPKFTISNSCNWDSLIHTQVTGVYDADNNPGGYGDPNTGADAIDITSLEIFNLTDDVTYDAIGTIAVSADTLATTVTLAELTVDGVEVFTDHITDGVYEFVWTVGIDRSPTSYNYTVRKLFLPELCGLLAQKQIAITTCKCKSDYVNKWLYGFALVKSLEGSAICGDLTAFQEDYDEVYNYLTNLKCEC